MPAKGHSIGRILVALLALGTQAAANVAWGSPLKYPKRMVDGQTVDLNPLFRWWDKQRGERPLTGWVHIIGSIVGTNAWGWTVNAAIEETPAGNEGSRRERSAATKHDQIVLKNPPTIDLTEFEKLTAQMNALNADSGRLSAEADRAEKRVREISARQDMNRRHRLRVRGLADESRRWRQAENNVKTRLKAVDQQIKKVDAKLAKYSDRNKYAVDCLALKLGQTYLDLPVYNHGVIIK